MMYHHRLPPLFALCALILTVLPASGQTVRPENLPTGFVIVVEDQTQMATASRPIYMASGANSWDPGDPDFQLEPRSDKRWQLVVEPGVLGENVEFKFTLGGWNTVELDPEGQEIPNRTLPDVDISNLAQGERPVIELTIPNFRSGNEEYIIAREYRPLEATGELKRLQVASGAGAASRAMRDLLVWLPPGYHDEANADTEYPVLYMMDGQNLFADHALIPGEWRADEAATALIESGSPARSSSSASPMAATPPASASTCPVSRAARTPSWSRTSPRVTTSTGCWARSCRVSSGRSASVRSPALPASAAPARAGPSLSMPA
jgi:hypothetical protein